MNPFEKPLADMLRRYEAAKPTLVKRMGATALLFINENFRKQGFQGETFELWDKRKDNKDPGRPVLVGKGTGHLRQSPFMSYADAVMCIITSSLPYSKIHNEGGDIAQPQRTQDLYFNKTPQHGPWRFGKIHTVTQQRGIKAKRTAQIGAHITHMPKRQFMGPSPVLNNSIREMLKKEIPQILKIV